MLSWLTGCAKPVVDEAALSAAVVEAVEKVPGVTRATAKYGEAGGGLAFGRSFVCYLTAYSDITDEAEVNALVEPIQRAAMEVLAPVDHRGALMLQYVDGGGLKRHAPPPSGYDDLAEKFGMERGTR